MATVFGPQQLPPLEFSQIPNLDWINENEVQWDYVTDDLCKGSTDGGKKPVRTDSTAVLR
jgi:hypothetical protein